MIVAFRPSLPSFRPICRGLPCTEHHCTSRLLAGAYQSRMQLKAFGTLVRLICVNECSSHGGVVWIFKPPSRILASPFLKSSADPEGLITSSESSTTAFQRP